MHTKKEQRIKAKIAKNELICSNKTREFYYELNSFYGSIQNINEKVNVYEFYSMQ